MVLFIHYNTETQSSALIIADSLYSIGYHSKAISYYEKHTNKVEVYLKMALAFAVTGNFDKAILNYEKGLLYQLGL